MTQVERKIEIAGRRGIVESPESAARYRGLLAAAPDAMVVVIFSPLASADGVLVTAAIRDISVRCRFSHPVPAAAFARLLRNGPLTWTPATTSRFRGLPRRAAELQVA